ncbi:sensor histidine kinase [Corynebacterium sp.]|uniref:sensor histidine kinase n=1 Tax=Corynebacterium sp. TaxID=1720 RepID=UPI0026DCC8A7|nr:histidine kinase [Corynebacterium sp.]MDO5032138.1 histidine kinase [Corynebacterium sp.]
MKSVLWSLALGVLFLPALLISVVMLPWIPLVAAGADHVARFGARWLGTPIAPRRPHRWFDWQQFYHLILQLLIGCAAFAVWLFLGFIIVVLFVSPFAGGELRLGSYVTSDFWIILGSTWTLAFLGLGLLYGLGRLLSFLSVSTARLALSPNAEESRAVLIDSFSGERRRIERELHDGPQQYLTALKLNLAAARRGNEEALDAADHNASLALASLRDTVRGIAPQVLFDRGLVAALEELLVHSGLKTTLRCHGARALDETPALLAYHCVAEGLTNAVKHGQATRVEVDVDLRSGVKVSVTDDGRGPQSGSGTGLAGLSERAAALGGTVTLEAAGQGACLRLELP